MGYPRCRGQEAAGWTRALRWTAALLLLLALACGGGGGGGDPAPAPAPPDALALEEAFPGITFQRPVGALQDPLDPTRWYVVEQGGRVVTFKTPSGPLSVTVDLSGQLVSGGEAGLLGMAFHPQFASNGKVYLSYTGPSALPEVALLSHLSVFTSPDGGLTLDPASEEVLLTVEQPFGNHNGGHIAFGPDGYLYLGLGDGGSGGDPRGNAQDTDTLLGAMLRLDVDGGVPYAVPADNPFALGGGRPEIYAWGLRNPWRWSFDRATGELWCGDVGQGEWEEVDRIALGLNYGWNIREGAHCFLTPQCDPTGLADPVVEYSHAEGCSVTGGFVYRGSAIPGLPGTYLYGDFCSGRVWGLLPDGAGGFENRLLLESGLSIASFAEGSDGEVYVLDIGSGRIFRLISP